MVSFIECRRDASFRPAPMDIGNQEEKDEEPFYAPEFQCWGGATNPHEMEDWN